MLIGAEQLAPMLSEREAVPLLVALGALCVLFVRSREVPWWVGLVFFLTGFVTATTTPGLVVTELVRWARDLFTGG